MKDKNYTPKEMADDLVAVSLGSLLNSLRWCHGWRNEDLLHLGILDPAMGCGNILSSVKDYLMDYFTYPSMTEQVKQGYSDHISKMMLYGVEIDPIECEKAKSRLGLKNAICGDYLKIDTYDSCLSWYPEEIADKLPKMDLIIGNPPFLGGGKISGTYGDKYAKGLRKQYDMPGGADYCTYFLRKAERDITNIGHISYIVTNTISQGATRKGGLQWMVANGYEIYNASTNVKWPGDAKVTVSIVHLRRKGINNFINTLDTLDSHN